MPNRIFTKYYPKAKNNLPVRSYPDQVHDLVLGPRLVPLISTFVSSSYKLHYAGRCGLVEASFGRVRTVQAERLLRAFESDRARDEEEVQRERQVPTLAVQSALLPYSFYGPSMGP